MTKNEEASDDNEDSDNPPKTVRTKTLTKTDPITGMGVEVEEDAFPFSSWVVTTTGR